MSRYLYMIVTPDRYELPCLICDDVYELSEQSGYSVNTIRSCISRRESGAIKHSMFCRVYKGDLDALPGGKLPRERTAADRRK